MSIKYSIVDKLFFDNWLILNPAKEGKIFGLFSFESDSVEDLYKNVSERDKKRAKSIVNKYKEDKSSSITDVIQMLDNTKYIIKYEKKYTNDYGQAEVKVLEVLNHNNEYLGKYLVLI